MQLIAQAKRFCMALLAERGSLSFRDYEAASLLAWREQVSQTAAPILDRQLGFISWINRQSKEKLILLHADSKKEWPIDLLFPLRAEKIVARVSIRPRGTRTPALKCDIGFFCGRLFSIEFDQFPRAIFPQSKTLRVAELRQTSLRDLESVERIGVKIFADPMGQERPSAQKEIVQRAWSGWMKEWAEAWEEIDYTPEDFTEAGDTVVVRVLYAGRGKGSQVRVDGRFWYVFKLRDGKLLRWELYPEEGQALEAAGLSE